jgi:serine protease Do
VTADLAFQLDLPVEEGALVLATLANGPAAEAGIREDEVIVEIDGEAIEVAEDLGRVLDALTPGDVVDVRVVGSDGDERTHRVTLGTKPLPTEFLEP